jgi:hypothetical protein
VSGRTDMQLAEGYLQVHARSGPCEAAARTSGEYAIRGYTISPEDLKLLLNRELALGICSKIERSAFLEDTSPNTGCSLGFAAGSCCARKMSGCRSSRAIEVPPVGADVLRVHQRSLTGIRPSN